MILFHLKEDLKRSAIENLLSVKSNFCQVSQVYKIPVVPKEAICSFLRDYLDLVTNVKSYWWSLLPLNNLTNSNSLQNEKTQIFSIFIGKWREVELSF